MAIQEVSEWNDAKGTSMRMHGLFHITHEYAMELHAYNWFQAIRRLYIELYTDIKDPEEINKKIKEIQPLIQQWNTTYRKNRETGISMELNDKLYELETLLRIVHDKAGYKTMRGSNPMESD